MLVKSPDPEVTAPEITLVQESSSSSPPPYEGVWRQNLNNLQHHITNFNEAEQQGRVPTEAEAQKIAAAMRDVGDSHPDPKVKGDWHRGAKRFSRAMKNTAKRSKVLGLVGALVNIPFVLVGTSLHIVAGVIHATGSIVGGIGEAISGVSVGESRVENEGVGADQHCLSRQYSLSHIQGRSTPTEVDTLIGNRRGISILPKCLRSTI